MFSSGRMLINDVAKSVSGWLNPWVRKLPAEDYVSVITSPSVHVMEQVVDVAKFPEQAITLGCNDCALMPLHTKKSNAMKSNLFFILTEFRCV